MQHYTVLVSAGARACVNDSCLPIPGIERLRMCTHVTRRKQRFDTRLPARCYQAQALVLHALNHPLCKYASVCSCHMPCIHRDRVIPDSSQTELSEVQMHPGRGRTMHSFSAVLRRASANLMDHAPV